MFRRPGDTSHAISRNSHLLVDLGEDSDHDSSQDELKINMSSDDLPDEPLQMPSIACTICKRWGHTSDNCRGQQSGQPRSARESSRAPRSQDTAIEHNDGMEKWRRNEQYSSSIEFSQGFENATDIHGEFNRPARIGYLTNTYIKVERPTRNSRYKAFVYAADDASEAAARKMLEEWRDEIVPLGSRSSARNFDRIKPGSLERRSGTIEDPRRKYTKDFSHDETFACFYTVPWHVKSIPPQTFLGQQFNGLDPIKMDHRCYIKVIGSDKVKFGVLGANEAEVRKACKRLQILQYSALAAEIEFLQFYLIKNMRFEDLRQSVLQKEYKAPQMMVGEDGRVAEEIEGRLAVFSDEPMDVRSLWTQSYASDVAENEEQEDVSVSVVGVSDRLNVLYTEIWFKKVLELSNYYMGHIKMRASIGTCCFGRGFASNKLDLSYFCQQLYKKNKLDADIDSVFTQELGDVETEAYLLDRFFDSNSPFLPDVLPAEIDGKAPHSCSLEFAINNGTKELCLKLSFKNLESANGIATWIMPSHGDADFDPFLDINYLDLRTPYLSYNLGATWSSVISSKELYLLPLAYSKLPEVILINPAKARDHTRSDLFFHVPESGGNIPLREIKQMQTWRFKLKDSDYLVELNRIQTFDCVPNKVGTIYHTPRKPRFGVQVFHPQWDVMLAENATLRIGQRAAWLPEEYQFFPPGGLSHALPGSMWERGSGIREFLRIMGVVEKVICGTHMTSDGQQGKERVTSGGPAQNISDMLL